LKIVNKQKKQKVQGEWRAECGLEVEARGWELENCIRTWVMGIQASSPFNLFLVLMPFAGFPVRN
jgi:hypothetical protein